MDCVGCEKCRLWGKLQVLGLGTALKILFSVDGQQNTDQTVSISLKANFIWLSGEETRFAMLFSQVSKNCLWTLLYL